MGERVLIVDDSLTVRMHLGKAFQAAGFAATLCETASEARAGIARETPDLVVLDVLLPDADGVEFLTELREASETAQLPVIMLSTEAELKDRVRGLRHGANEYVGKPYEAEYVVARAKELLRPQRDRAGTPLTVLVIDDSMTVREELGAVLREAGYEAVMAASGEEGLRRAMEFRPDAVIVDGVMPGLDGPAVIRQLRLEPSIHATPCLLLTATEGATSEVLALDAGADAYVRKSESSGVILARLGAMLRASQRSRKTWAQAPSLIGPKRILAVDDSPTYLQVLADQLRQDGYEVLTAGSGEEALRVLSVERVDCILLDLVMPGLSGTETCRLIKRSPAFRTIPLSILTARDETEAMIDGINAGADDFMVKSAEFDVLKARLRAQLRRKEFEDENRRMREEILHKEAEARAAHEAFMARSELLGCLENKNAELQELTKELQTFAYSISHDLRQPLRSIDGFSKVLLDKYADRLDADGRHYLERVRAGTQRMGRMIDALLALSRVTRREVKCVSHDLSRMARRVCQRLIESDPERTVEIMIADSLPAFSDPDLMESVIENLLGNAWKFTAGTPRARIEVGLETKDEAVVYFVKDNGVGFNMDYAGNLFGPFQRFHQEHKFSGMGIGLATAQRIIHRHGGRIWAESAPGQGATFWFTLGEAQSEDVRR